MSTLSNATIPKWHSWRTRLDANFRLAVVSLFSAVTVICITPFAIYRFWSGDFVIGVIDLTIVGCICVLTGYAWRSGNVNRASLLVSISNSVGCVLIGLFAGLSGLLWMSPTVMANFLLVGRRSAIGISVPAIAAVALTSPALTTPVQQCMFIVTATIVSIFAYVFAARAELQRNQLETVAVNDPLTGAFNRRNLEVEISLAMSASVRTGAPVALAVLDLDHFKRINDQHGHDAGDTVLVNFADLVRRNTRRGDLFFRLGGEEFALLLPGANAAAARRIAETVRAAVERELAVGNRAVTVSIGATILLAGDSPGSFLKRADSAMYRAKRNGRNGSVVDDRAGPSPRLRVATPIGKPAVVSSL